MYYTSAGSDANEVVILLHGLLGSSDNLGSLSKSLSDKFFVISPDMPSHGHNNKRTDMDYNSQAKQIFALLDELGLDSVHCVGHSMGGKAAMSMALMQPNRIKSIVVADIAPIANPRTQDKIFKAMQNIPLDKINTRMQALEYLKDADILVPIAQFLLKNLQKIGDNLEWRIDVDHLYKEYSKILDWDSTQSKSNVKALFIKGGLSNYINAQNKDSITKFFPNAVLKELADTTHWLHAEKPDEFNKLVYDFLTSNR